MVAGHSITHDPHLCVGEWVKRHKLRLPAAVWHARIIAYMAGSEAAEELLGATLHGDRDDRDQIEQMADELPPRARRGEPKKLYDDWTNKLEPRLRAMTRMLVRRHRDRIELVAKALLAKPTLSQKAVDKLVGRSVNDVKPNSPFHPETHRRDKKPKRQR